MMQYWWITLAWASYFFLHSFLANLSVKNFFYKRFPAFKSTYRLYYNAFATVTLAWVTYFHFQQTPHFVFEANWWAKSVSSMLIMSGLWILRLAFKNYDLSEFAGVQQQQMAQEVHTKLNVQGMNRYVRHPIYLGALLIFIGIFMFQPTWANLILLGVVLCYIFVGAYLEEQKLIKAYGQLYKDYQKKVKMLIPKVL